MIPVQIKLYDLFREELHLPDDKAAAFVAAIKEIAKLKFENGKRLSTKEDICNLKDSIHLVELKIEQSKGAIYKAIFWTGIIQLLAILVGVLAIVKYMR